MSLCWITVITVSKWLENLETKCRAVNVLHSQIEMNLKSWCLSGKSLNYYFSQAEELLRTDISQFGELRVWQFYKQILILLPSGDCFSFHTELYKYNLRWLLHIQFRAAHITEHRWQDSLQLMLHTRFWLHPLVFLRTDPSLPAITEWAMLQINQHAAPFALGLSFFCWLLVILQFSEHR